MCMFCYFITHDCLPMFNQSHVNHCREKIALCILNNNAKWFDTREHPTPPKVPRLNWSNSTSEVENRRSQWREQAALNEQAGYEAHEVMDGAAPMEIIESNSRAIAEQTYEYQLSRYNLARDASQLTEEELSRYPDKHEMIALGKAYKRGTIPHPGQPPL